MASEVDVFVALANGRNATTSPPQHRPANVKRGLALHPVLSRSQEKPAAHPLGDWVPRQPPCIRTGSSLDNLWRRPESGVGVWDDLPWLALAKLSLVHGPQGVFTAQNCNTSLAHPHILRRRRWRDILGLATFLHSLPFTKYHDEVSHQYNDSHWLPDQDEVIRSRSTSSGLLSGTLPGHDKGTPSAAVSGGLRSPVNARNCAMHRHGLPSLECVSFAVF